MSAQPPATRGTTVAPPRRRRRALRWVAFAFLALLVGVVLVLARLGFSPAEAWQATRESQPIEIVRYAEYRLLGHPVLEAALLPALKVVRRRFEREPAATLADLGKGQRAADLPAQRYSAEGLPLAVLPGTGDVPLTTAPREVHNLEELERELGEAGPGTVIELAPGRYAIDRPLVTARAGAAGAPISLRGRRPGTVTVDVSTDQGFVVNQPYWLFENLTIRGLCANDRDCEHAFHVVAGARGTVIRNNLIENFNAHVKVNGADGQWPDGGLLQFNTITNATARTSGRPVSTIDIVGASDWVVADNRIEQFVKAGGNGISYGVFMKGGGERGRIERNLVVCTPSAISQAGVRVGISLGNGGTGAAFCRSPECGFEHADGLIANNVVAHCNDVGIDVFRSPRARVAHNTLINTRGILVRDAPAEADVAGNLLEGGMRERRGGQLRQGENLHRPSLEDVLQTPDALDLRWRQMPPTGLLVPGVDRDFCGQLRPLANPPGATVTPACLKPAAAAVAKPAAPG